MILKLILLQILRVFLVIFGMLLILTGFSVDDGIYPLMFGALLVLLGGLGITAIIKANKQYRAEIENADVFNKKNQVLLVGKIKPEEITTKTGFVSQKIVTISKYVHFALNDDSKEFLFLSPPKAYRYDFDKIIDFDYVEDGEVIMSGKSMATLTGGLAFGFLGAMVGASGKRKQRQTINKMEVVIHINDFDCPRITIPIFSAKIDKNSMLYKPLSETAEEIIGLLKYAEHNKTNGLNDY